jgi:large subunit ribosomal protein L9
MKIILQEGVDNLGTVGDVINVRDGYARNFLLPRGKAVLASAGELAKLERRRDTIEKEKGRLRDEAQALGAKIQGLAIGRAVRVSEEGHLYGSVGVGDIVDLLAEKGFTVEKKQVLLPESIKALGIYTVPIRLHQDVTVDVTVTIEKEKEEKG